MRCAGEQNQRSNETTLLQALGKLEPKRSSAVVVHVHVVGLVDQHEIPRFRLVHAFPTPCPVQPKRLRGSHHAVLGVPVVALCSVGAGGVPWDADVEHLAQPYLPLFHQARRCQDQQPSHLPGRQQRRKDQTSLDGLAEAHVVCDEPACGPFLQHALAHP